MKKFLILVASVVTTAIIMVILEPGYGRPYTIWDEFRHQDKQITELKDQVSELKATNEELLQRSKPESSQVEKTDLGENSITWHNDDDWSSDVTPTDDVENNTEWESTHVEKIMEYPEDYTEYMPVIEKIVECPVFLTDIDGKKPRQNKNGEWLLKANQDVIVVMELPDDIEELRGRIISEYSSEIKASKTGKISFAITCSAKKTKYLGTIKVKAKDSNLRIGAMADYGNHLYADDLEVNNDEYGFDFDGVTRYVAYGIYTSCRKNEVSEKSGGLSGVGFDISYRITPN